tara:strand:- start:16 stop:276 length:261 start_codon:yes stop_codon:yes gene_type:complete
MENMKQTILKTFFPNHELREDYVNEITGEGIINFVLIVEEMLQHFADLSEKHFEENKKLLGDYQAYIEEHQDDVIKEYQDELEENK